MPYADLTDVRCRYEIMGTGDPMLMIPGLGSTCERWGEVTDTLAQHFTLILPDNRDAGLSVAKRKPQTLIDLASDAVELLDYLQLDRAHVLGLSFGGIIAQRLAIDHSSRVDRLVLISTANRFGPYVCEIALLLEQTVRRFPFEIFRKTMEVLGNSPEYYDAHASELAQKIRDAHDSDKDRAATIRQLSLLGFKPVAPPDEYRIQSLTLVMTGEQDMLIPHTYARRMADEIPGCECLSIPNCGHNPLLEQRGIAVPRIVEFLSRSATQNSRNNNADLLNRQASPAMEVVH